MNLSIAPAGAKAVTYDLALTLNEVNELANLIGLFIDPMGGCRPIDLSILERVISKMANAARRERVTDLVVAAQLTNALIETMQVVMTQCLMGPPSGLTDKAALSNLIELLDGPAQRDAQGALKKALDHFRKDTI